MIKASEIRIGNWVLIQQDGKFTPFQVDGVCLASDKKKIEWFSDPFIIYKAGSTILRYGDDDTEDDFLVKPIHLTHEILEKLGFEKRVTIGHSVEYFIGENPVTNDWMLKLLWQNSRQYPFYRNGHHVIKYLHQLQNLYFALTGEELNYQP